MLDAIKPLLDSDLINEDTRQAISEAWETKLTEMREEVRTEIREEFANRYEHDKDVMVEALDRMVTESLEAEVSEIVAEKKAIAEDRVSFNTKMRRTAKVFEQFLTQTLSEEVKEFRNDRKTNQKNQLRLEEFVVEALTKEVSEFGQEKKSLVERQVRMVAEGKKTLAALQKNFVQRSAKLVQESVSKSLGTELGQLKEDIKIARENNFGRRLYEAFASEFSVTHLNENAEIRKLQSKLATQHATIVEAQTVAKKAAKLIETKNRKIDVINETVLREKTLANLLKPLGKQKGSIMQDLLENVQTDRLESSFEKYLPSVLKTDEEKSKILKETKEKQTPRKSVRKAVSGNKKTVTESIATKPSTDNVVEMDAMKKLAGIKQQYIGDKNVRITIRITLGRNQRNPS